MEKLNHLSERIGHPLVATQVDGIVSAESNSNDGVTEPDHLTTSEQNESGSEQHSASGNQQSNGNPNGGVVIKPDRLKLKLPKSDS